MFIEQLIARDEALAREAAQRFVNGLSPLTHAFDCSFESTEDFGGKQAAFIDFFPTGNDLATDHKKFGGIFVRVWVFGEPKMAASGLFLGAERAEQSEPRRGVAFVRKSLGSALTQFESKEDFIYHTWSSGNFPWTTKSSRAVARQLEQFISFREESLDPTLFATIEARVAAAIQFLDSHLSVLKPIRDFGQAIIREYYSENLPVSTDQVVLSGNNLASLASYLELTFNDKDVGLHVLSGTASRLVASLLTKRFMILTGLSGSGKTKLAHAFAAWITESPEQYRIVAVGADWTTNENLLGYQDALRPEIYRKPTNGALDLMLRARDDAERPYFLILDEMNLSHVERYFADMLSAIESGEPIALHSATEDLPGGDGDTLHVPARLALPKNLFIVGTVNVDETTYMFSPKVLDRGNVIEFRATAEQIESFLDDPQPIRMDALAHKGAGYGAAFVVAASGAAPSLADLPASIHADGAQCAADLKARMVEAFKALAPIGAEFGFRTALEIARFVAFHATLTGPGWQFSAALDAQVYQKLLPKLHGSERRLGPVLKALEDFCTLHGCTTSLEKIQRMQDRLKDGFTSFAEA